MCILTLDLNLLITELCHYTLLQSWKNTLISTFLKPLSHGFLGNPSWKVETSHPKWKLSSHSPFHLSLSTHTMQCRGRAQHYVEGYKYFLLKTHPYGSVTEKKKMKRQLLWHLFFSLRIYRQENRFCSSWRLSRHTCTAVHSKG